MKACSTPHPNHRTQVIGNGGAKTVTSRGTGITNAMTMIREFWRSGCQRPTMSRPATAPRIGAAMRRPPRPVDPD